MSLSNAVAGSGASRSTLSAIQPAVNAWSAEYLDAQYRAFKEDPSSLEPDLVAFFQGFDLAASRGPSTGSSAGGGGAGEIAGGDLRFHLGVHTLVQAYRTLGHIAAKTDPFDRAAPAVRELTLAFHGLTESDLNRSVRTDVAGLPAGATLTQLVAALERSYCGPIGSQFAHITDGEQRAWLQERCERNQGKIELPRGLRAHILERLTQAEQFERFLQNRYPGEKRFSLEGAESVIVLLDRMIEEASNLGVREMVLGMAHRGRLNVLRNIMGKTLEQIFTEFEDAWAGLVQGGGDVKYHRGYSGEKTLGNGKKIKLVMASNPSHLESVNGVVLGRCRAKQRLANDTQDRASVAPLLIHGDAALIGQGMVTEALNMSQLDGYTVGGALHVVINNLIGFTTGPEDARSTRYCTDVALPIESPVFHVNGEDPEAVAVAGAIAVEFRQKFKKDVFVDVVCYRKYGHNEQDEASFTQPHLTALIQKKNKEAALMRYAAKLREEGVITDTDLAEINDRLTRSLDEAQKSAKASPKLPNIEPGGWRWAGVNSAEDKDGKVIPMAYSFDPVPTGVNEETLREICRALGTIPDGFHLNPKLTDLLAKRSALPTTGAISYADAESIAYGSLLLEGYGVRISGQDARRGTFSHRHAVLRDTVNEERYIPLNHMRVLSENPDEAGKPNAKSNGKPTQAKLCVYDSPLSEAAVMAFDYGYSLADPHMLVCWEAQFGDFVNGAQIIIDQYLTSAEAKWERWSGLTLLLPHGYEGAGPEHSSARLERFLQSCAEENIQVVYPSTAAQCFHMFRRQIKAKARKPLIVMTPKSMLRIPTSDFKELTTGHFRNLIDDPAFEVGANGAKPLDRTKVTKVIWCTGKIYHELDKRRTELGLKDVAIVRIEQLYPFDAKLAKKIMSLYPKAAKAAKAGGGGGHVWAQEEPRNMGAYIFIADQFRTSPELGVELAYVGRPAMAAPAVGSKKMDKKQQESVLTGAIGAAAKPDSGSEKPETAKAETNRKVKS